MKLSPLTVSNLRPNPDPEAGWAPAHADTCPVCRTRHRDAYMAADCCLWKDLSLAERVEVAKAVDAGASWLVALDVEKP